MVSQKSQQDYWKETDTDYHKEFEVAYELQLENTLILPSNDMTSFMDVLIRT